MSNMPGDCGSTHPDGKDTHHHMHPHVGMRKVKSILAIFCGFCLWQLIRLFVPGLEVHPIFIYIYGMMEIRETSEKTKENGKMRILATLTAVGVGLPIMFLTDWLWGSCRRKPTGIGWRRLFCWREACLSYARQNYWDAMRFAGWQLQSISF